MREHWATYVPRLVSWIFDSALWRLDPAVGEKTLCLTFDDGPSDEGTSDLLRVLDRFQVRGTFFVVGRRAEARPDLVRSIVSDGHTLGNHTHTHVDPWRIPSRLLFRELSQTTRVVEEITGRPLEWMRPPFGHLTLPMIGWCKRKRQRMVLWDLVLPDYRTDLFAADVQRFFGRHLRPRSIVCLHDTADSRRVTPALLMEVLPKLLGEGWRFETLEHVQTGRARWVEQAARECAISRSEGAPTGARDFNISIPE